ncbi:MAG TPA: hypothetical protein VFI25_06295 [Planctomycetota bacterium]|nr:hypothetical protein [Planctomycetota bacterium]
MGSLGSKTVGLFLAAALLPLLGVGAAVFLVTRDALRRDAQESQEAAGRAAARVVEDDLDRARAKRRSLAALVSSDFAEDRGGRRSRGGFFAR